MPLAVVLGEGTIQFKPRTTCAKRSNSTSFKEQALERADKDDIPKVAQDLGLAECNGQLKQDTLLSRFLIEFPFILDRGLIA